MKIKSVKTDAHSGTWTVTLKCGIVTEYTDMNVPDEVIKFIRRRNENSEIISSVIRIYY